MSFEQTFCPSPWFHARINNIGNYEYCRWATKDSRESLLNIREIEPVQWFQHGINDIRQAMLDGKSLPGCQTCYLMEQHGKVSGRQKQLLKIGVTVDRFQKTMLSSPWLSAFMESQRRQGATDQFIQDWQIDLGNFCNSACLFCSPYSSSRLAAEHKKLGVISTMPEEAWCNDPDLLQSFIENLVKSPNLVYLHFIGGETLITPAFKIILQALVDHGLTKRVAVGFTTNLTCWDDEIIQLLRQFQWINLGMSVECLHPVNDYVRYGSELPVVKQTLARWITVATQQKWYVQIRITPTILTIGHLDTIYQFAMENQIAVESCNFLDEPAFMRPSVLPMPWRRKIIDKLENWLMQHKSSSADKIVNTRNPDFVVDQIIQDAQSYISYLFHQPDESHRLGDLVSYLHLMEHSRKNSLLDYLPEYEQLLRSSGY